MRKGCVVYISNTNVQMVCAEVKKGKVEIKDLLKCPLDENTMLNGVILDDGALKKILEKLKAKNIKEVHLVVDSAKILAKTAVIPPMKEAEILQFVKDELAIVENSGSDSLVYDYAYLGKGEQGENTSKILYVGVERKFIDSYLDVFKEMDIKISSIDYAINSLISLVKNYKTLKNKTFVITQIDGQNINSVLFANNEYTLTSRSRVFASKGTAQYNDEIGGLISQLKQFASSSNYQTQISDIYFWGISKEDELALFESVRAASGLNGKHLPALESITVGQGLVFDINDYLYCLGSFMGK